MFKILAGCGAGVNSSQLIKEALESEMKHRGYEVQCDAVMLKDITEDMLKDYDVFTPIADTDLGFKPEIPVINAGPVLYKVSALAEPVFDQVEQVIKNSQKSSNK